MLAPATTRSIRVVLADDHELVRTGIKGLLTQIEGVEVIAEARDGEELVALLAEVKPDLVVTDIAMPGMDGIAAIAEIHSRYPEVRILVLSMHDKVDVVKRAIANGARGYLMKDAPPFELEQAVLAIMKTGGYFSPSITQHLLQPSAAHAGRRAHAPATANPQDDCAGTGLQGNRLSTGTESQDHRRASFSHHGAAAPERHRQPDALCGAQRPDRGVRCEPTAVLNARPV